MKKTEEKTAKLESKHKTKRRQLLKSVAGGAAAIGSAPSHWTKPILKQTILPSHAATSGNIRVTLVFDNDGDFNGSSSNEVPIVYNSGDTTQNVNYCGDPTLNDGTIHIDPPVAGVTFDTDLVTTDLSDGDGNIGGSYIDGGDDPTTDSGDVVLDGDIKPDEDPSGDAPHSRMVYTVRGSGYSTARITINFSNNNNCE